MNDIVGFQPVSEEARQLGLQFRNVRERKGVSLRDLAEKMKLSVNTIRAHEAGATPFRAHHLRKAARVLGCRPGLLLHVMEETKNVD